MSVTTKGRVQIQLEDMLFVLQVFSQNTEAEGLLTGFQAFLGRPKCIPPNDS